MHSWFIFDAYANFSSSWKFYTDFSLTKCTFVKLKSV